LVVDRERVLDAAERVIAREGAGVSIDDIAIEAGVTKPIVYDRVGSRSELADALAERLADRMVKAAGDTLMEGSISEEALARFIEVNLVTVSQHRELFLYVTGGSTEQTALGRLKVAERSIDPMTLAIRAWRDHFAADGRRHLGGGHCGGTADGRHLVDGAVRAAGPGDRPAGR
jgi:AcrR family transcriptional regulator